MDTMESPDKVPNEQAKKKKKRNKKKKKAEDQEGEPRLEMYTRDQQLRDRDEVALPSTPLKDKLGDSFYNDTDSSEDEGLADYKIGGYHPMHVGEILIERYVII